MKILVIVNESPWGSGLGVSALRLTEAMADDNMQLLGVFFREEGVYTASDGQVADRGTPALAEAWLNFSRERNFPLLLCSSAAQRRLREKSSEGFREAGLAEVLELMSGCDRVVTF